MGIAEIAGRISGEFRINRLRQASGRNKNWSSRFTVPTEIAIQRCLALVPGARSTERVELNREFHMIAETMRNNCAQRAEAIVNGRHTLLGKPVSIDPAIDWHRDPSTGHRWSYDFFNDISYHKIPSHVDFKDIWELGRQQYVVELSRSYLLNANLEHANLAREMIISWIDGNAFCKGIHWTSGLEVAMRSISWIWTLANLHEFPGWKNGERERIIDCLGLHAYYLENHLSYYSSPYNHIIGESAGLYLIAKVLDGTDHANRWKKLAAKVLCEYGPRQFYEDGFCVEQAVGYHYFTLGFLVMAELATRGDSTRDFGLSSEIERAFAAGRLFQQSDGYWPAIGDVDSAQSIPVSRENFWDFSSTHQLASVVLNEPKLACPLIRPDNSTSNWADEVYWLTGCSGLRQCAQQTISINHPPGTCLPKSGYYIVNRQADHLIFDAGPIAHGLHRNATRSAAHGHSDTLQVLYGFNGRQILIDSGMPNYAGNPAREAHFRACRAHNTIELNGAEYVRAAGGLNWTHEVETPKLTVSEQEDVWSACGEVRWPGCSISRHILMISGQGLWIADYLQSIEPRNASWFWQFPIEFNLELTNDDQGIIASCDHFDFQAIGTQQLTEANLASASTDSHDGWISPGYGVVEKSRQLRFNTLVDKSVLVLICIGKNDRSVRFNCNKLEAEISFERPPVQDNIKTDSPEEWTHLKQIGLGNWSLKLES